MRGRGWSILLRGGAYRGVKGRGWSISLRGGAYHDVKPWITGTKPPQY